MSTTPPASGSRGPTPPPGGGGGVSPLIIGKSFLKQYYQVLSTSPEHIAKFYKPTSVLSQAEGSSPSTPAKLLDATDTATPSNNNSNNNNSNKDIGLKLKDRLMEGNPGARIELAHGAIDAQESVGGGVLLVVTGHMVSEEQGLRRSFCHTFFLNPVDVHAKKRQYYVHNDVLRFLHQEQLPGVTAVAENQQETPTTTIPEEPAVLPTPVEETTLPAAVTSQVKDTSFEEPIVSVEETKEEPLLVEHGVEETKEEPPTETPHQQHKPREDTASPSSSKDKKDKKEKRSRSRGRNKSRSSSPNDAKKASATKPKPNSWASLVASSGGPSPNNNAAAAVKRSKPPPKETKTTDDSTLPAAEPSSSSGHKDSKQQHHRSVKRDPENTLVIKNITESTKEADVRGMFEPLCAKSKAKILGITVAGHRSLAFVDYDSPGPVALALEMQQKERFRLNGRNLDVEQKSLDRAKKSSSSRGGFHRSGSPGNGGRYSHRGDRKSGRGGGGGGDRGQRGSRGGGR